MTRLAEKPESFEVKMEPNRRACAGASAAYLCRHISSLAGSYAPGIQERLFVQLAREYVGGDIGGVWGWYERSAKELQRLGYRLVMRRVAFRTPQILGWIEGGAGFRGAILHTDRRALRDEPCLPEPHAVAITARGKKGQKSELLLVDPWPGAGAPEKPPKTLEEAHRQRKYGALVVYWAGWG